MGIGLRVFLRADACGQSVQLGDESLNVFCRAVSPGQGQVGGDGPSICNAKWSRRMLKPRPREVKLELPALVKAVFYLGLGSDPTLSKKGTH